MRATLPAAAAEVVPEVVAASSALTILYNSFCVDHNSGLRYIL